jgi:hypothetical protein
LVKRDGKAHDAVGDAKFVVGHVAKQLCPQVWALALVVLEFLVLERDCDIADDARLTPLACPELDDALVGQVEIPTDGRTDPRHLDRDRGARVVTGKLLDLEA